MKCARCGEPATKRIGFDLVEPDSGVRSCDACETLIRVSILATLAGDKDIADDIMGADRGEVGDA